MNTESLPQLRARFLDRLNELSASDPILKALPKRFKKYNLNKDELLILKIVILHYGRPEELDVFLEFNKKNLPHTELGGDYSKTSVGFTPTIQTYCFIMRQPEESIIPYLDYFQPDANLIRLNLLVIDTPNNEVVSCNNHVKVTDELLSLIKGEDDYDPKFSMDFPATRITTELDWKDLVLAEKTRKELNDIKDWMDEQEMFAETSGLGKMVKKGYRAIFYGPSGTGKTLCATLLGKYMCMPVYKINLGTVVSKYVGETEKNLAKIFDMAEDRNWILFFDEAESLFGKRTNAKSANDRFANQETGFLLQRIENYNGIVILASNLKDNMDPAFMRRFQNSICFPVPGKEERLKLWQNSLQHINVCNTLDLKALAEKFDITGGTINNVLRYLAVKAAKKEDGKVGPDDVWYGLKREYEKDGKLMKPVH